MNCHFTYTSEPDLQHLRQGDLLYRTPYIESLLRKVHTYYLKPTFKYFIILTQSCDLERRDGKKCKSDYISLGAVLPFEHIVKKEFERHQKDDIEKIGSLCDSSRRSSMYQFLEKLLNNNHTEFFYLQEDNDNGLPESCCAFLRLSIAIRSFEHYDECLKAKFIELREDFRAKLGWLIGNLYSRVGTEDWVPDNLKQHEFKRLINEILDKQVFWKDKSSLKALKVTLSDKQKETEIMTKEYIQQVADGIKPPKRIDKKIRALNVVKSKLLDSGMLNDDASIDKLLKRIEKDPIFSANF